MGKITVHRKGYHRGPYTMHRDGKTIHVKRHYVPPTTYQIKDRGKPGKGKDVIGPLKKGELSEHGYSINKPARARRRALKKDMKEDSPQKTWHRLNAQVIFRKRKKGKNYKKFKADRNWVKKQMTEEQRAKLAGKARKKWMSMSKSERAAAMPGG